MKYILKSIEPKGTYQRKDENTLFQVVNIKTGIVDQPYEGFTNEDTVTIEFPSSGLDADGIIAKIQQDSVSFINNKYPDIA